MAWGPSNPIVLVLVLVVGCFRDRLRGAHGVQRGLHLLSRAFAPIAPANLPAREGRAASQGWGKGRAGAVAPGQEGQTHRPGPPPTPGRRSSGSPRAQAATRDAQSDKPRCSRRAPSSHASRITDRIYQIVKEPCGPPPGVVPVKAAVRCRGLSESRARARNGCRPLADDGGGPPGPISSPTPGPVQGPTPRPPSLREWLKGAAVLVLGGVPFARGLAVRRSPPSARSYKEQAPAPSRPAGLIGGPDGRWQKHLSLHP